MKNETSSLTVLIDPRVHFSLRCAASERDMHIKQFVECLIVKGITQRAMDDHDPIEPVGTERLYCGDLWHDDESVRLFNLASFNPGWLSRSELKLWSLYCKERRRFNKKLTVSSFREFYNNEE